MLSSSLIEAGNVAQTFFSVSIVVVAPVPPVPEINLQERTVPDNLQERTVPDNLQERTVPDNLQESSNVKIDVTTEGDVMEVVQVMGDVMEVMKGEVTTEGDVMEVVQVMEDVMEVMKGEVTTEGDVMEVVQVMGDVMGGDARLNSNTNMEGDREEGNGMGGRMPGNPITENQEVEAGKE